MQVPQEHVLQLPHDARVSGEAAGGSLQFIGNATMLLRWGPLTLLTDPNFLRRGERVYLGYGLFSKRRTDPALTLDALPPVDLVLLSHLHGDHFDRVAYEHLPKDIPILTTPAGAQALQRRGFRAARGLQPWDRVDLRKGSASATLTSLPGAHAHGPVSRILPPVMGSLLEFQRPGGAPPFRLYISGDTLVREDMHEVRRRFPDIDVGVFHLGGTRLFGVILATMDAEEGVEALRRIRPRVAVPIHYNDYTVFRSPLEDFRQAAEAAGLGDGIHYVDHGDVYPFEVAPQP